MFSCMRTPDTTRVWRFVRAGGASPDPANVVRRAQSFAVAASESGTVTLVCVRDDRGMAGYLVTSDGSSADQAALHLAQTVAARAEPMAELPALDGVGSVGWLRAHPTSVASRDVQAGADPSEVSRRLVVAMRAGQWVAIVLRPARRNERKRVLRWYAHRLGTANPVHHITDEQAVVASIVAGGADADEVRSLLRQLAAALPGFDVDTKVSTSTRWRDVAALDAVGIGSWLGVGIGLHVWMVASLVGSVPAALALGIAYGLVPTRAGKVAKQVGAGVFGAPPKRLLPPRRPREKKEAKDNGRKGSAAADGSYPLASTTFLLSPSVVVGLVAPHAGGASGASTTERRAAPEMLLDPRIGPALGQAGDDPAMVHLPAGDFPAGVAIVGKQGSGKAQPLDTWFPVPASVRFPSGWARNEELQVSDRVFARDGETTEVVGFSEVFDGQCYEVSLDDGQKVICDAGHLWSVSTSASRADGNPPVILRTEDMAAAMSLRRPPGYAIELCAPIAGPDTVLAYPESQIGAGVHCCRAGADATVAPEVLRASPRQRLAVLAGLMDTEGGIGTNGRCALVFCREDTAASVVELVRSLGIKVVYTVIAVPNPRWHVRFVTNTAVSDVAWRAARLPEDLTEKNTHLFVTAVSEVGTVAVRCISVDHPEHLYLTDGFVPTHNSQITRSLYAWHCLERVRPSGRAGYPGARNALVVFESKGDEGADVYRQWAQVIGDESLRIDLVDPTSYAIDVFAIGGTVAERARFIGNMMIYAFEPGAIQGRSFESLDAAISGALTVTDTIATSVGAPTGRSPIYYTHVLLGGVGDARAVALAGAIFEAAHRAGSVDMGKHSPGAPSAASDLMVAQEKLSVLFGGKITEGQRRTLTEAARNKIGDLLAAESWWSPARRKVSWRDILQGHHSVILNTGVTAGAVMDERITGYMSSLLMYSLRDAIMRTCSGWQKAGESVSIFSDELSLLAGSSPEVIAWTHDQGRAYGVRPFFATQRPEQLSDALRTSLQDFGTFLCFAQSNPSVAAQAAADMAADGGEWTVADIVGLDPYTAVVRTHVGRKRQPAVPVRVTNWEADMAGFSDAQGWPAAALRP